MTNNELKTLFESRNEKIDQMHKIITGGDNPRTGFIVRIDRIEQRQKRGVWAHRTLFVATIGAGLAWLKQVFFGA